MPLRNHGARVGAIGQRSVGGDRSATADHDRYPDLLGAIEGVGWRLGTRRLRILGDQHRVKQPASPYGQRTATSGVLMGTICSAGGTEVDARPQAPDFACQFRDERRYPMPSGGRYA